MNGRAAVVGIEVASKQKYLFETDKLREMVGASRLMAELPIEAQSRINKLKAQETVFLFQPLSGGVRLWSAADAQSRNKLLDVAWHLKKWLDAAGIEHTSAYLECDSRHFTDPSNEHITVEQRRPDPDGNEKEPDAPSLSWVNAALTRRLGARKFTTRSDARPTNSFFAPCNIYGADVANHWDPLQTEEPRRQLVGVRARAKLDARDRSLETFNEEHLQAPVRRRLETFKVAVEPERAITFRDLADDLDSAVDRDDSFIAFLCADADDMGRLLPLINWNATSTPWMNNRDFIKDLDDCVKTAFHEALMSVAVPDAAAANLWKDSIEANGRVSLPALPQLLGGDDLWTVARKEVALELATTFAGRFGELTSPANSAEAGAGAFVRKTLRTIVPIENTTTPALTMSVGVAFAKCGHPAYAMAEAAEDLLKSAKLRRKGQTYRGPLPEPPEGCIDWHIIESSLVESIDAARGDGWRYHDSPSGPGDVPGTMLLTTRPWTIAEAIRFREVARDWATCLPRRKREQVEDILRRGLILSRLAWKAWLQKLQDDEPEDLAKIAGRVPEAMGLTASSDPWREIGARSTWPEGRWFETPFLDLLALSDVLPKPRSEGKEAADADADD